MKYFLAMMMALAISFSSATFAEEAAPLGFTDRQCVELGELAYNIAAARDQGADVNLVIDAVTSSNGEATDEEVAAFSDFVNGIYAEVLPPETIGVAVIQSCLQEINS